MKYIMLRAVKIANIKDLINNITRQRTCYKLHIYHLNNSKYSVLWQIKSIKQARGTPGMV